MAFIVSRHAQRRMKLYNIDVTAIENMVEIMKVHYDDAVDALYIELSEESPEGAVELSEGINVDTTSTGRIAGIEILDASSRIDLKTILSYSVDVDKNINALTSQ